VTGHFPKTVEKTLLIDRAAAEGDYQIGSVEPGRPQSRCSDLPSQGQPIRFVAVSDPYSSHRITLR
jgi:hypothetical protein